MPEPTTGFPFTIIRPGDCLLYRPDGWVGWLIVLRTFTGEPVSHVEIYDGDGYALASRDGIGVNRYLLRRHKLAHILRPRGAVDLARGRAWFARYARGQRYDFQALWRYLWPGALDEDRDRMICSALAVRYYRACGFQPFAPDADADLVSPASFLQSPAFAHVWRDKE